MAEQKYRVIRRLEAGGMAEVYLGEAVSMQGFRKTVAIKRVLPHLAQNEAFIQMFLDEARLSARLDHANIVSVFDISQQKDTYFLVMEYVEGANLKKIIDALRKRGQRIDLGAATLICLEACRGLSYAHELAGDDGQPLRIVHRDISPPNILLTRRGEVKLADFGLAKASTQIQTTDPGVVKGKFSYLSPEAAEGKEVDARADIFAIGIVLWEMLSGKRLFLGENDYATVKLVQRANIPRLAPLNREVDEQFEEILLRALTRDPERRFQSARELGDALAGYLFNRQLKVTAFDLANLVQLAMSEEPSVNDTTSGDGGSLIDRLIQDELDASASIEPSGPIPTQSMRPSGLLEDPASWFSDDDLKGAMASGAPAAPAPQAARAVPAPPPTRPRVEEGDRTSGAWRESGLAELGGARSQAGGSGISELGPALEPDDTEELTGELIEEPDGGSATTGTGGPAVAGGASPALAQSRGGGKVVVIALVAMAAIGVVVWLGLSHP